MRKMELVVHGKKVVDEDYRLFLVKKALCLGIKGFNAINYRKNGKEMIVVKLEGSVGLLEEYIHDIRSNFPEHAEVEEIEDKCIDTYVMDIHKFLMYLQYELWYRFAKAASGNEIGSHHPIIVENDSIR